MAAAGHGGRVRARLRQDPDHRLGRSRAPGPGAAIVTIPVGAVTVSPSPTAKAPRWVACRTPVTNLGASLGTALVGAVLIASLTTGLVNGVQDSSAIPANVTTQATTQLEAGVPFTSDSDELKKANVPPDQAGCDSEANSDVRLAALRGRLWVVALIAVVALFFTGLIPTEPVGRAQAATGHC